MARWGVACTLFSLVLWWAQVGWTRDDFQSWNAVEITKRLGPRWEVFFAPEIRLRNDASELFYHEYRQGVRWKPLKHLQVGMNYLFVRNESSGKPLEEHAAELDVTPQANVGLLKILMRGRLELRTVQGSAGEQEWRVRLMPKVVYPVSLGGHRLSVFASDDVFYDDTADAWNQNRLSLSVSLPLRQARGVEASLDVYYMLQSQRSPRHDWNSNHILGTKLGVKF